jgi:hypothetical protein
MIALGGTPEARESCDPTMVSRMIALDGTPEARESCDPTMV